MRNKAPKFDYPAYQDQRCGCKVSWYYYDKKEDAEKASEVAIAEGEYQASQGYDFGYCAPGSITPINEGEYAGKFEVCIP